MIGPGGKGLKRDREESDDDEDEKQEEGKRRVSGNGWVVLEWLVHIWEKDQEERGGEFSSFRRILILLPLHLVLSCTICIPDKALWEMAMPLGRFE